MNFNPFITSAISLSSLFCSLSNISTAQSVTGIIGAHSWMVGGTSVSHHDVWSADNNPAATTGIKHIQAGLYSEQRFNETNLRLINLSIVVPFKYLHIAATINHFGYAAFNQQKAGISLAKALNTVFSLAVQVSYITTSIKDYGQSGNTAIGAGIYARPLPKLHLGFVIFNPARSSYGDYTNEKIPSYGRLGCSYEVSGKVTMHAEADQSLHQKITWRGGIYYKIHEALHLAAGAASNPVCYTFGTALYLKKFRLDLASSFHEVLGLTPHLGLSSPLR